MKYFLCNSQLCSLPSPSFPFLFPFLFHTYNSFFSGEELEAGTRSLWGYGTPTALIKRQAGEGAFLLQTILSNPMLDNRQKWYGVPLKPCSFWRQDKRAVRTALMGKERDRGGMRNPGAAVGRSRMERFPVNPASTGELSSWPKWLSCIPKVCSFCKPRSSAFLHRRSSRWRQGALCHNSKETAQQKFSAQNCRCEWKRPGKSNLGSWGGK